MDYNGTLFENSRRLRFEAFSNLAIAINSSVDFDEICHVLLAYVKFILECFVFTVNYRQGDQYLHIILFRGEYSFTEGAENVYYNFFATEFGQQSVPVSLTREQILQYPILADTLFGHQKVKSACILPYFHPSGNSITVAAASKNMEHFNSADFRFLKLIGETLSSKIGQVLAQQKLEQQTIQLAVRNEEVTRLYQNLEEIVKERTAELTQANEELQTLFYRTSHDFRAPLTNIIGLVNIAEMTDSAEDKSWVLQNCRNTIKQLDHMLYKLNTLSRLHAQTEKRLVDFGALVAQAEQKCVQEATAQHVSVMYKPSLIAEIRGFSDPFFCIFENLFENSIQYGRDAVTIEVSVSCTFKYLTIVVTDNGTGIKPAILNRVFDMYFRGDARSQGSGLGLYVVHKIIKMLDASIRIDSVVDVFTQITMQFPLKIQDTYLEAGIVAPSVLKGFIPEIYGVTKPGNT